MYGNWMRAGVGWLTMILPLSGGTIEEQILTANRQILARQFEAAEQTLMDAWAQARPSPPDLRLGAILSNLGHLHRVTGQPEEARRFCEEAASVYRELDLPGRHATALANLGAIAQDTGEYLEAENLYRRAILLLTEQYGPGALELAEPLHELAGLYIERRDFTKADRTLQRVLAIQNHHLGPANATARTANSLGLLSQHLRDHEAAEEHYLRAAAMTEAAGPANDPVRAAITHNLACLYGETGRTEQAEALLGEALGIWRESFGEDHPPYAKALMNLGVLQLRSGRFRDAGRALQKAVAVAEKAYGPRHPEVGLALERYAEVLRKLRRKDDARRTARRAREILAGHSSHNLLHQSIHVSDLAAFR